MADNNPTRPSDETRAEEARDAQVHSGKDRDPTPDEEREAEAHKLNPETAEHYEEMAERGANQKGEGRIDSDEARDEARTRRGRGV